MSLITGDLQQNINDYYVITIQMFEESLTTNNIFIDGVILLSSS